ncbi:hypothetical protein ACFOW1_01520 [Parasediminibacterium paludis]|uniref:Hydrolase of HD superfamily n=1 Tax=Parasediminibacterium paludis TaxID=908966 RepID=A0ABV8PTJ4_9BACT
MLQALMHDASEAYLMDIPTPIKAHLPDYKAIENNLMKVIAAKFGFDYPLSKAVKEADTLMLRHEWAAIMLGRKVFPIWENLTSAKAKSVFLECFHLID